MNLFSLSPTRAWQVYQLLRVGGSMAVSVIFARGLSDASELAQVETVGAVAALASGPMLSALGLAYLRRMGAAGSDGVRRAVNQQFRWVGAGLLGGAALGVGAVALLSGPSALALLLAAGLLVPLAAAPLVEPQALAQGRSDALIGMGLAQGVGLPLLALGVVVGQPAWALAYFAGVAVVGLVGRPLTQRRLDRQLSGEATSVAPFAWRPYLLLLLSAMAAMGADALDAVIVRATLSPEEFLLFRYGGRELPLTLTLATAASAALSHRLAGSVSGPDRAAALADLRREHQRLLPVGFAASALLMLTSQWLFAAVYGVRYGGAYRVFDLYLLLVISRVLLPQAVHAGLGRERVLLWASVSELILHVGLTLLLLPWLGVYAPALSALAAYSFEKLYLLARLRHAGVRIEQVVDLPRWGIYSAALLGLYLLKTLAFTAGW